MIEALYHWSPTTRRKQILRYGLRPAMVPAVQSPGWRAPYICLSRTPSAAWGLSGGMHWAPAGSWDLWQTYLYPDLQLHDWQPEGEVRVAERIFKSRIWYVASRLTPPVTGC